MPFSSARKWSAVSFVGHGASVLGAPEGTVRSRVRLAKEALRRRIEENPAFAELRGPR